MVIKKGDKVKVEYTGKFEDGEVFDKTEEGDSLEFTVGSGEIIPGFDKAVEGMELNEEKTVTVKPEEAYGNREDNLIKEFPKDSLPKEFEPKKGTILTLRTQNGQTLPATILDITESNVILDLNHPLAGKNLIFDIKVVGITSP
jgi:peptidylprolyl isomerase